MQEASLLFACGFGFGGAAVVLAIFRPQLTGTNPTVLHLLLASLVLEAIKLVARGASYLFLPSDWTQVEQFVASRAIYSFFHALSLPVLFVSILLSLRSLSAHDPPPPTRKRRFAAIRRRCSASGITDPTWSYPVQYLHSEHLRDRHRTRPPNRGVARARVSRPTRHNTSYL